MLDIIKSIDLSLYADYLSFNQAYRNYFLEKAGREHYQLLAYLASLLPPDSKIVDIGTFFGSSALAFAAGNSKANVITYDIVDHFPKKGYKTIRDVSNITCKLCDGITEDEINTYLDAAIILLDIDPHDGIREKQFIQTIMSKKYKGLIICDDICMNKEMLAFWNWIPIEKIVLTHIGHWTGTGIVICNGDDSK